MYVGNDKTVGGSFMNTYDDFIGMFYTVSVNGIDIKK